MPKSGGQCGAPMLEVQTKPGSQSHGCLLSSPQDLALSAHLGSPSTRWPTGRGCMTHPSYCQYKAGVYRGRSRPLPFCELARSPTLGAIYNSRIQNLNGKYLSTSRKLLLHTIEGRCGRCMPSWATTFPSGMLYSAIIYVLSMYSEISRRVNLRTCHGSASI